MHYSFGVMVFDGSVCIEWLADGEQAGATCGSNVCQFWEASLGTLHSDLILTPDSHWLKDAQIELHILNVSSYMNESIKELGKEHQAKLSALISQNK